MKKFISIMVITALIILNGTSAAFAGGVYTVQEGDKLWKIAQKYNISWQELAEYNSLKNPHLIFPNQKLNIPDNAAAVAEKPDASAAAPADPSAGASAVPANPSQPAHTGGPMAKAPTGTYAGQMNDGIEEFLGIRYGEMEPFKAPTDVTTTADDVIEAKAWGYNCIQPYDEVELASQDPCSQDCLYLNIWTKDSDTKDKPVIVWIHGGGYTWGGATDPMYDGELFVRNLPDGEDCVFITINYRLSFMGSSDLSVLEGYTEEYADAINLAKLDQTQALKWVNENIDAWGGNTDNITIMGHSSGGAAVSQLMADPDTNRYFSRVIEHSGVAAHTMIDEKTCAERSKAIFDILGVKTVGELTALTDKEISDKMTELNEKVELGSVVADGDIISKTWWDDLKNGSAKDIELMIGSVNGENDYASMDWDNYPEPVADYKPLYEKMNESNEKNAGVYGRFYPFDQEGLVERYLALGPDKVQLMQDLYNDMAAPYVSQVIAETQSKWNGDTYVYYWEYAPAKEDVIAYSGDSAEVSPWSRALHSMDVCFAFGTLEGGYTELTGDYKLLPENLSPQTQAAWYNFAKTGNPSNEMTGAWAAYNDKERETMVITPEAEWECVSNFRGDVYEILKEVRPYGEK